MKVKTRLGLLGLLLLIAGFDIGLLVGPSLYRRGADSPASIIALPAGGPALLDGVPDVRQSTGYSCGAAALQAVLGYYGINRREQALMDSLKTSPEAGTPPGSILRVAGESGLRAELREGLAIKDLATAVRERIPVIVCIQAWSVPGGTGVDWKDRWEDGHYVVVIGVDGRNVYVEDPSLLGSRGVIPREEFESRWHDYEGDPPHDPSDRSYVRAGIFITGKAPEARPAFTKVE